jgi:hypothetical protein
MPGSLNLADKLMDKPIALPSYTPCACTRANIKIITIVREPAVMWHGMWECMCCYSYYGVASI